MYGEYGLKNGVTNNEGKKIGGYIFMGNAEEIFEKYFGSKEPLRTYFDIEGADMYGSLLGDAQGAKNKPRALAPKDVEISLACSMFEFYNGSIKSVSYTRDQILSNNRSIDKVEETMKVEIKPGFKAGNVLTYTGKGHEQYTHGRSNLKIKLLMDDKI